MDTMTNTTTAAITRWRQDTATGKISRETAYAITS
jgi:hypothetical protein